ncbi:MAG: hypothetical protein JWP87_5368 [Labilithrix sp.]|nr:hypothetical protein [Labilithrix sp.]
MSSIAAGSAKDSFNQVHLSGKGEIAMAAVGASVDLLDPDSMLAFFSAQMTDVRHKLGAAMADQETRNDRIKTLASVESDLIRFKEKGIKPGEPGWETFKADIDKARALMGDSLEGTKLGELMKKTEEGVIVVQSFKADANSAKAMTAYVDAHPGAEVTSDGEHFNVATGHAQKLDPAEVDSLVQQVKGYRDSLQNDNAMNMIRVQQLVESSSQIMNLCSNIMKKLSDAAMSPINNMR